MLQYRRKLEAGQPVTGLWMMTASPVFGELVRRDGLDFVVVDMEHGAHTLDTLLDLLRVIQGGETAVFVRVPSHDPTLVSRVLDRGADGVMVPRVDDPETAAAMASAARYPPHGTRGLALGALRASKYGADQGYRDRSDREVLVMVQIESRQALDNAEAIAAAPGVDMLFFGPTDLAANMRMEEPADLEAYRALVDGRIRALCAAGIRVGTITFGGHTVGSLAALGTSLVVNNSDIGIMNAGMASYLEQTRRELS